MPKFDGLYEDNHDESFECDCRHGGHRLDVSAWLNHGSPDHDECYFHFFVDSRWPGFWKRCWWAILYFIGRPGGIHRDLFLLKVKDADRFKTLLRGFIAHGDINSSGPTPAPESNESHPVQSGPQEKN